MSRTREQSLNLPEFTSQQIKDLNDTQISYMTRESVDKDYRE